MTVKSLTELIWRWYQNGKPMANDQHILKADISQKVKLLFADSIRQRYYESMKADAFNNPDYAFLSPILSVVRFQLTEPDIKGKRRADMSQYDLYRMPINSHFTNVYPYSEKGCGNTEVGEITQVSPGEENFYIGKPDLSEYKFFVVKGRGIDIYNLPPCVTAVDIEATYDVADADIDMSIASQIIDQILGVALGIKKQYYSEGAQKEMAEQNIIK